MLVDDILSGIDDDTPLANCILFDSPVKDLVLAYNQHSIANPDLPSFSTDWTGKDFKRALAKVETKNLITLLYNYATATKDLKAPLVYLENEKTISSRLNQQLAIKMFLMVTGFTSMMFFLFLLFVANKMGYVTQDSQEYKTVLDIATDILKYIFTAK